MFRRRITWASLVIGWHEFQSYLFAVFHRTRLSRAVHVVCMPLIVLATIATAMQMSPWLGGAFAIALAGFYGLLAWRNRLALLGLAMMPIVAGLTAAAYSWSAAYDGGAIPLSMPAAVMVGLALVQTVSHVLEHVPI